MHRLFKLGGFCFAADHPDTLVFPPNFLRFETKDVQPAYFYTLRFVKSIPNPVGVCTAVREDLIVYRDGEKESRLLGIQGMLGFYALYRELDDTHAEVMIAARDGKAIRFNESTVRPIGRVGAGVRGISIEESDEVIGMICVEPDSTQDVLVLSENGYGKRTDLDEYRITNRGGKGVKTINVTEKTGKLISIQAVTDDNDLMIINRSGLTIRTAVSQIRLAGRATQGVRIINLRDGDAIASVMAVPAAGDEEEVQSAEATGAGDATPDAGQPAEE